MKSLLFVLSLFFYSVFAIVIQPPPTQTVTSSDIVKRSQGVPTHAPQRFVKRDLDETLSLYEYWASECTGDDDSNYANVAVSGVNNLWQTVTNTVYCGNNNVKTITKTVTRSTTTTKKSGGSGGSSSNNKPACDDKCWSTYLWRK